MEKICALHGPVLTENLEYYIGKYDIWSKYEPEDKGVFIAYASIPVSYTHLWNYVNQFAEFNNYINSPVAVYKEDVYKRQGLMHIRLCINT